MEGKLQNIKDGFFLNLSPYQYPILKESLKNRGNR